MDSRSFDNWTRTRAHTTNRRRMLGLSLTAGIGAALGKFLPASAQFDGGGSGSCSYAIELTSSTTSGATVTGTLVIDVGEDGAIDTGSLTLSGQAAASVVGQATGPAIDLLAALADGSILSLTGVGSGPIGQCPDSLGGYLANATSAQLGTWSATPGGDTQPTPTPTPATQSGSGSGGNSGGSSGGGTTTCPPTDCGSLVLDPQSCQCVCSSGTTPCGGNCCPSGSSCNNGICGCPGGTTQCGTSCVPDCFGDEFLNLDTCQCEAPQEPACLPDGTTCNNGGQCCNGYCAGGTCQTCFQQVCYDVCTDTKTDVNNCGNCGNPCIGTQCINGSCQ